MKTRLDPVVQLRERREQRTLEGLARATDEASQAQARLSVAQQQSRKDTRGPGAAAEWVMADAARERALVEVKRAQVVVEKAAGAMEAARRAWCVDHRQTEVVRRAANARRDEATREQGRRDTRELDELGAMMFWRKPA